GVADCRSANGSRLQEWTRDQRPAAHIWVRLQWNSLGIPQQDRCCRSPASASWPFRISFVAALRVVTAIATGWTAVFQSDPVPGIRYTSHAMIVYSGSIDDSSELIQFFRREVGQMKALRRIIVNTEKTVIWDVNKNTMEFPGLTYGSLSLEELLRELGV